jgi:hypothetical protein
MSTSTEAATKVTLPTEEEVATLHAALRTVVELTMNFRTRLARCSDYEEHAGDVQVATVEDIGRLFSAYQDFGSRLVEAMDYVEDVRKREGFLRDLDTARIERGDQS